MVLTLRRYSVLTAILLLQLNRLSANGPDPITINADTSITRNEQGKIPLTELLNRWQTNYHINFNYNASALSGKWVAEKDAKTAGKFSETQLAGILNPLGLKYVKLSDMDYAIRPEHTDNKPANIPAANTSATPAPSTTDRPTQSITGIVSNEKGEPVAGATVTDKSTNKSVVANAEGRYTITVAGPSVILVFHSVGYQSKELAVGNKTIINVTLKVDAKDLTGVVVTALGIKREQKALGYSISTLDGSKVNTVKEVNVVNALSGKIAGVDVRSVSSDPAGSVFINIRGNSSIIGNDQPLFVVDGTPIASGNQKPVQPVGQVTVDYGNPIADINPDDIASITILKGASAAALYGSRAGSGVVLITTKSGSGAKKGLGVSVNSTAMFDQAWQFPEFQNEFGAGDVTSSTDPTNTLSSASWGPRLDVGTKYVQWNSPKDANGNSIPTNWVSYPNRVKDFYQLGQTYTNNVALTGKDFRLSYTNLQNKGISPNTDLQRNTLNLSAGYAINPKIKVNTNVTYTNNHSNNRPTFNRGSASNIVYTLPANIDTRSLKNYWMKGQEGLQQFSQDLGNTDNPYFVAYQLTNGFTRDRIMGNLQLTIDLTNHLTLMGRTGLDLYSERDESKRAFSAVKNKFGGYGITNQFNSEQNTDFLLTYKNDIGKDWQLSASAGANRYDKKTNTNSQNAASLVIPGVYNIGNAAAGTISPYSYQSTKRINSVYAMGNLSYKNYAFLDLTARNDWTSSLPAGNNSYFYPSAALSLIVSDMLNMHSKALSYAKLRVNISKVGKDTDPYNLYNNFYFNSPDWGNVKMADFSMILKNNRLKPEMATSYELGTDLKFFSGRLNLEATYYNASYINQIISIPTAMSSGYSAKLINAGEIRNRGIELGLSGTPIAGTFKWDIGVNFTRNRNKVIKLDNGITSYQTGSAEGVNYLIMEGAQMGDMYGKTWVTIPDGPLKGKELLTNTGASQQATALVKVGNYNSDFMIGITNTFTYKRFTLNALLDWRQGGQFYSYVHMNLLSDGRTTNTLRGRDPQSGGLAWNDGTNDRTDGMIEDGYIADGSGGYVKNTHITDPENFYGDYYWKMIPRNTFSATYVKLREVSLTYLISKNQLGHLPISNLSVSLIGRNLFSWTAAGNGYDPETAMTISNGSITPGTTSWSMPYTRSFGAKLGFNF